MKLGVHLGRVRTSRWVDVAVAADELGYESVWMPEHLVLPVTASGSPHAGDDHPPIPPDIPVLDPFATLGFLGARTQRVRLGTHVYNVGLRHPFATARGAATLDVLSGGRLDLGVGVGWLREEWDAAQLDFATRGARADEALEVCRRLWGDDVIEHHGRFFDFAPVMFEPKPAQPGGPRLHVGGDGPAALRRAATVGDGWAPMNHAVGDLPASIERLAELRAAAGRPGRTEVTVAVPAVVDGPDDLSAWQAAGADRLLVTPWRRSSDALTALATFADRCGLTPD